MVSQILLGVDRGWNEIVVSNVLTSPNVTFNGTLLLGRSRVIVSQGGVSTSRISRRIRHFLDNHTGTSTRLRAVGAGTNRAFNRRGRTVFRKRVVLLRSRRLRRRVVTLVGSGRVATSTTTRRIVRNRTSTLRRLSSRCLGRHTTSMHSVNGHLLHGVLNLGVVSLDTVRSRIVLITTSLAPSRATRLGLGGILNFVASTNNHASRASVVTHSLRLPTVINANDIASRIGGSSCLVLSTMGGRICIGPAGRIVSGVHTIRRRITSRGTRLTGLGSLPTVALSNRRMRIYTGVNAIHSIRNTRHGNTRNINLCHARFLFVSHSTLPARRRRFTTCGTITRTYNSRTIVIHAVSVNNSGRLPCVGFPGRRGPFLN